MNRTLGKLTAVALGAALVAGFLRSQVPHPAKPAAALATAPIDVVVAPVRTVDVPIVRELFGALEPRARVAVASKVLARVEDVAVEVGAAVAAGAILATLDDAAAVALAASAEADAAGAGVILFDPIFQGLAISLRAGEVAAMTLSRVAVPVLYERVARRRAAARAKAAV